MTAVACSVPRGSFFNSLLGLQLVFLPPLAPYALAYYNPLACGTATARQAILIGWGEGLDGAADYLNHLPYASEFAATTLYTEPLRANFLGRSLPLNRFAEADYFIDYVNMEQRALPSPGVRAFLDATEPVATVDLAGARFAAVYAMPRPEFGGAFRVEQYLLETDNDNRGERLSATLRWKPLIPYAVDWRPRLELLDPTGKAVATAEASPARPQPADRPSAVVVFRLPDSRVSLTLALSVVDENGAVVQPSSTTPWGQLVGHRVEFPSILVRVR